MRTFLTLLVISTMVLSSCSSWRESRANPSNWFGKSRSAPVAASAENPNPLIPEQTSIFRKDKREIYRGTPIDQITELTIERTSNGAIVKVTGVSRLQGAFDVRLVSETKGEPVDGVLTFTLKAQQPTDQGLGNTTTRTVRTGRHISNQVLEQTKTVRVIGERNERTTRRR